MTSIRQTHYDIFNVYIQKRINAAVRVVLYKTNASIQALKDELTRKDIIIEDHKRSIAGYREQCDREQRINEQRQKRKREKLEQKQRDILEQEQREKLEQEQRQKLELEQRQKLVQEQREKLESEKRNREREQREKLEYEKRNREREQQEKLECEKRNREREQREKLEQGKRVTRECNLLEKLTQRENLRGEDRESEQSGQEKQKLRELFQRQNEQNGIPIPQKILNLIESGEIQFYPLITPRETCEREASQLKTKEKILNETKYSDDPDISGRFVTKIKIWSKDKKIRTTRLISPTGIEKFLEVIQKTLNISTKDILILVPVGTKQFSLIHYIHCRTEDTVL